MIDIEAEKARIEYETFALVEYDKSLYYSIQKCERNPTDKFYSSVLDTLKKKREQSQEWYKNLKEQEEAVQELVEWNNRAKILDKLVENAIMPPSAVEESEGKLRELKIQAYTAQAMVDLRM